MKKKVWLPTIIMFFFGVLFLMPYHPACDERIQDT